LNRLHEQRSHLPEGAREHTFLVYDSESGEIVHGHKTILFSNVDPPSQEDLEREALDMAAQTIDRDPSSLKALKVEHHELEQGAAYRVDPGAQRLERISPEQSS
jgi:hypothetical protein